MPKGTVKWVQPTKGYGFIKPTVGDRTCSSISRRSSVLDFTLNEISREYDLVENRGKSSRKT